MRNNVRKCASFLILRLQVVLFCRPRIIHHNLSSDPSAKLETVCAYKLGARAEVYTSTLSINDRTTASQPPSRGPTDRYSENPATAKAPNQHI